MYLNLSSNTNCQDLSTLAENAKILNLDDCLNLDKLDICKFVLKHSHISFGSLKYITCCQLL